MSRVKRYQNPEVYEALAAEYVLGTLRGKALLRFERLIHERPYIRYSVEVWERRLNALGDTVPERKPPVRVWQGIRGEISNSHLASEVAPNTQAGAISFWQRLGFWQSATALLGVGLAVLLVPAQPQKMPMPTYVSVLKSEANEPMVVTIGHAHKRMVSVRLMQKPNLSEGMELELWAIPRSGGDPISVGIISTDSMETQLKLSDQHWERVEGAQGFAISYENKRRISSGERPSGPLMYKGQCLDFI